jgi:hypothetical protein
MAFLFEKELYGMSLNLGVPGYTNLGAIISQPLSLRFLPENWTIILDGIT